MAPKTLNQETKLKILLSAKREFALHGFAGSRMDSIAKQASVNKAMLHYYFSSKEQLYQDVINYLVCLGVKSDAIPDFSNFKLTSSQKLAITIIWFVDMHFDIIDQDFHRIIAWDFAEGKNCMKMLVKDYFAPGLEKLEVIIKQGIENGEFSSQNPIMSVWSYIIFIISYINQQEIYQGSGIYDRLYGENPKQNLLDFLLIHIFKSLGVKSQEQLPTIPPEIMQSVQNKIVEMKNNRNKKI